MDEIKKFAVIGNPINHSLSPNIHKEFAKQQGISIQYKKIEPEFDNFETPYPTNNIFRLDPICLFTGTKKGCTICLK